MFNTTYIEDLVYDGKDAEISYRHLHTNALITTNITSEYAINVPYLSLTNKYKDFLSAIVVNVTLTPEEVTRYRYKPKMLSYDLYGTTELWSSLLEINNVVSTIDFSFEKLNVYDPAKINALINEILILEGVIK